MTYGLPPSRCSAEAAPAQLRHGQAESARLIRPGARAGAAGAGARWSSSENVGVSCRPPPGRSSAASGGGAPAAPAPPGRKP